MWEAIQIIIAICYPIILGFCTWALLQIISNNTRLAVIEEVTVRQENMILYRKEIDEKFEKIKTDVDEKIDKLEIDFRNRFHTINNSLHTMDLKLTRILALIDKDYHTQLHLHTSAQNIIEP